MGWPRRLFWLTAITGAVALGVFPATVDAQENSEPVTAATFLCQPVFPDELFGWVAANADPAERFAESFTMTVSVDGTALTFEASGTGADYAGEGANHTVLTASGAGTLHSDWWFEVGGTVVRDVDCEPHDCWLVHDLEDADDDEFVDTYTVSSQSTMVGFVADNGASMTFCWRPEPYADLPIDSWRSTGQTGLITRCEPDPPGTALVPGPFTCEVMGDPLTRADVLTPVPGDEVPSESESVFGLPPWLDPGVLGGPPADGGVAQPADMDGPEEPTTTGLAGLVLLVAILCGVAAAAVLVWAMAHSRSTAPPERQLGGFVGEEPAAAEELFDWAMMYTEVHPPPPPPPPDSLRGEAPPHAGEVTFTPTTPLQGRDAGDNPVRLPAGRSYHWRPREDSALVWAPDDTPRGGQWVLVDRIHVDANNELLRSLARYTPDGGIPPPPPPGIDVTGGWATRTLQPDPGQRFLLEDRDVTNPRGATVTLIGDLPPGTYLTGTPEQGLTPIYDHTRRIWGWARQVPRS